MSGVALHRPRTLAEALAILDGDEDAKPVAGGVSLVAIMNARLLVPGSLVSLRSVAELQGIRVEGDGTIVIGAMTRHREVAAEARLTGTLACVRNAAASIANPAVRNMGTIGGSISLADPGADFPPALVAAGAAIEIAGKGGSRTVAARDFFAGWYTTALAQGELVTAIRLPASRPGAACYEKLMRVAGDICTASIALGVGRDGVAHAAVGGCGPGPVSDDAADAALSRGLADSANVRAAGEILAKKSQPMNDVRGSAEYRRLLIPRMLARACARVLAELAA
jgi:CO/xanthine dehydrogenase FAD-binding subunit